MEPATKKRLAIASAVLFAVLVAGTLAGVLTAVAIRRQQKALDQPTASGQPAAPAPLPTVGGEAAARVPSVSPLGPDTSEASQEDPKSAFYAEAQRPLESLYMVRVKGSSLEA